MELIPVNSSAIDGYNYVNGTFYYRYKSSAKIYDTPWPESTYKAFLAAESKGRFIAQHVSKQHSGVAA